MRLLNAVVQTMPWGWSWPLKNNEQLTSVQGWEKYNKV
jgi:hypothetical protein